MVKIVNNLEISEDHMIISINPKVYPLEVVYKAAAPFIRRCYVHIKGDPEEEIIVEIKPKQFDNMELIGKHFNNILINYLFEYMNSEKGEHFMKQVVKRAIQPEIETISEPFRIDNELLVKEPSYLDDPYNIAKPWEETHGD